MSINRFWKKDLEKLKPTYYGQEETPEKKNYGTKSKKDTDEALNLIYSGANATKANDYYKKAETPFEFSLDGNALYNQYKDQYTKQAQLAREDAIGKAAAMTGGYGSSYAMTAGDSAYNARMDELNNIIPELYNMAYNQHLNERNYNLEMGDRYASKDQAEMENYLAYLEAQKNPEKEVAPESVMKVIMGITNNDELDKTLSGYAAAGIISNEMAGELYNQFANESAGGVLTNNVEDFEIVDEGDGLNLFGIDRDVTIKLPTGEEITLAELRKRLRAEGYSLGEANKAIKQLTKQLKNKK